MLRNYFVVAIRNILKYRFFSAINIFGMTVGITSCLLLILYVSNELSYDKFHKDADRIYQVGLHGKLGGQDIRVSNTCPPLAAAMVAEIAEVESATRIAQMGSPLIKLGDDSFTEEKVYYVDSNFFEFFSYKLKEGDIKTALKEPNTLVLTERIAKKYFKEENPVGKLIVIGDKGKTYTVTGIAENSPSNSHFTYNILVSSESTDRLKPNAIWLNNFMYNYYKLHPNTTPAQVEKKFEPMVIKYVGPEMEKFMGSSLAQMKEAGGAYGYFSTNILDIHLHSTAQGDIDPGGNIMYVYFFSGIAVLIMIIACINFMNLATARSAGRAKEVGLRKALGSLRTQMIGQFLAESMMYSFGAVVLSLIACYFLLPQFNELAGKELGMQVFVSPFFIVGIIGLMLVVGVVAGSYPAFYLTSFSAVEVLKGKVRSGMKSKGIRSFLVVFQFALSIFLIIFTVVVFQQIKFMQEKNLGIDKNNILMLENANRLGNNKAAFKNALIQQTGIVNVSYANNTFPGINNTTVIKSVGSEHDHIIGVYSADYEHQQVMKFELKEGRYFSKEFPTDSMTVILNEAAAREFGFENPIGQEILYNGNGDESKKYKVIGVMKNFNFESLRENVRPLCLFLRENEYNLLIRYSGNSSAVVENVQNLWKQHAAGSPFEYSFMDESFDKLFRTEQRMGQLFSIFSGLTIFIACLGLFALAAFTSEQRTKEIGIRKSMGASSFSLTLLLSKEFTKLVVIAFIPAAVIAWYVSDQWLQGFAFRVPISPVVFLLSGLSSIVIAWLTVSYQSVKASAANPVDSLRYE
ncbi:MAG: FtsX-like permease family protein [Cyclobacteriaceae bacterium]|nr:FtsX-like permease family protein [Cyclobacteriaceae bacterium]